MASEAEALRVNALQWQPCFRVIPSRYPTIDLYERVAEPADWETLHWLESLTNDRLRGTDESATQERVFGPGASVIMAPFAHVDPNGSRFADGTFGAFYAAATLATSIAETRYHRELFLRATHEGPISLEMRSYLADVSARFHDIRGLMSELSEVYAADSYVASQALARRIRSEGSNGIAYDSVRHHGGQCLAIYKPGLIRNLRQGVHLRYVWDGARIGQIYELQQLDH